MGNKNPGAPQSAPAPASDAPVAAQPAENLAGRIVAIHEHTHVFEGRILSIAEDGTASIEVPQPIGASRTLVGVHRRQGTGNGWELA